jgi:hypothetical protein
VQQRPGVKDGDDSIAGIGAAALDALGVHRGDLAVFLQADFQPDVAFRTAVVHHKGLLARQLDPDGSSRGPRQQRGNDFEIEALGAVAEAAADERLDDADLRRAHPEAFRQRKVHVVRHLAHRLDGQAVALGVVLGERRVRLELRMRDLGVVKACFAHEIRGRETALHIAERVIDFALDVSGLAGVEVHGARRKRFLRAEVRGQRAVLDLDQLERGARGALVLRRHRGDRLAPVANAFARQRIFVVRDRQDAVGNAAIGAREDGAHSGQRPGAARVDANDLGVGVRAAQDLPRQPSRPQVGGEARAPGDFLDAVGKRRRTSDDAAGHVAAALTASTIFAYPVQRQRFPPSASRISSSLGCGRRRSSASAAMIIPGVQKPHCAPSFSWNARWSALSRPSAAWASMVSIARPSQLAASVRQASRGAPSTSTVQAPHSPPSQPRLVPVSPRRPRR